MVDGIQSMGYSDVGKDGAQRIGIAIRGKFPFGLKPAVIREVA